MSSTNADRHAIVEQVYPLAHKLARRLATRTILAEDLFQVGILALLRCPPWDPARGAVSTWAYPYLYRFMVRYIDREARQSHAPLRDAHGAREGQPEYDTALSAEAVQLLGDMPREWQDVMRRRMEGETYKSIAGGGPIGRVQQIEALALDWLRSKLGVESPEESEATGAGSKPNKG